MAKRRVQYLVLAEDVNQQNFVRHFLTAAGRREFRALPLPAGGSGEQHVRENFRQHFERTRSSVVSSLLIVVTDADTLTVEHRRGTLLATLKEPLAATDPVTLLIPKRNIETWIRWLCGTDVDEQTDYKKVNPSIKACDVKAAADTLVKYMRSQQKLSGTPPSLIAALSGLQRVIHA